MEKSRDYKADYEALMKEEQRLRKIVFGYEQIITAADQLISDSLNPTFSDERLQKEYSEYITLKGVIYESIGGKNDKPAA